MSLYVVTHKYLENRPKIADGYKWLYVGAYNQPERREGYFYDDMGGGKYITKK